MNFSVQPLPVTNLHAHINDPMSMCMCSTELQYINLTKFLYFAGTYFGETF